MWQRKLDTLRRLEAEAEITGPPIACNPGTLTDPLPAVERAMSAFRRRVRGNPIMAYEKARLVLRELRALAAEVFGGEPQCWAFADGHTSTIDRVAQSLAELHAGRLPVRVVTTASEHIGGLGAFTADPRFVVQEVRVDEMVNTAGDVFFLSHLTYDTNLDNTAAIETLVRRPDGPLVVVDGNQALGQIPVDVGALGCHAYLASAHKWLGGPHGTGLLYLREDVVERWPSPFRAGAPLCAELPIGRWEPRGGQDFSRIAGVAAAVRAFQCHAGEDAGLRDLFLSGLLRELGDHVQPLGISAPNGRVAVFGLREVDVYPVYRLLYERGMAVKCIKKPGAAGLEGSGLEVLRIGFPWWTRRERVEEAVAMLAKAVSELAGEADLVESVYAA